MRIHVISSREKWAVKKQEQTKALKLFEFREQAYRYATLIKDVSEVVVHNTDGSVLFMETVN